MPRNLTDKFCRTARPPASGRREVSDALKPGLIFRITDRGVKSWSLLYRLKGEQRRDTIGRFPEIGVAKARKLAAGALEAVGQGIDPRTEKAAVEAAEAERAADTVRAVADRFIATYAAQRRWRDLGQILRNEAVAAWGDRPVASVTRKDLMARLDQIAARAPVRANRTLAVFRLFFRWCRARDLIEASPAADIDPLTVETARERQLSDNEITAFWHATEALGWPYGDLFRLLLLTGCRRQEIGSLRWAEVDMDKAILEISGERIKGGRALVVPLSRPAVGVIGNLPRVGNADFVFSRGKAPVSGYGRTKPILDALMLVELCKTNAVALLSLTPWRLHDLRRTARSGLARLGVAADIAEMCVGHALSGMRRTYDRYDYLPEKRAALEKWGAHVLALTTPPAADRKVVKLRKR